MACLVRIKLLMLVAVRGKSFGIGVSLLLACGATKPKRPFEASAAVAALAYAGMVRKQKDRPVSCRTRVCD